MLPEGTGMKNGVDLAVAEAGGVVAGYCLEVVNLDDASPQTGKWDGAVEAENANKAVGDPLAIVYIGTYNSGAAKVSIPINNRAHMAQVTPANTYPGLTKKRGAARVSRRSTGRGGFVNYFRPIPADDIQGAVGAKWAKRLGVKKVYILNDQELYGKGIADVFEATAKKIGLAVVANEGIDWKQPDQKPILTKVRASGADLVYLGGVIETGAQVVIRQMKEVGLVAPRTRFMGPDGLLEEELLKGARLDDAAQIDEIGARGADLGEDRLLVWLLPVDALVGHDLEPDLLGGGLEDAGDAFAVELLVVEDVDLLHAHPLGPLRRRPRPDVVGRDRTEIIHEAAGR